MAPEIILYAYELAPNPQKLFHFLAFFKIPYKWVEIPVTMPRPMLAEIGVTYRRAPLLSIGSDMYVDTALIVEKIADIAQHSSDCGLKDASNHVEYDALGQMAWQLGAGLIPLDWPPLKDEKLISDRVDLIGRPFGPELLKKVRPGTISKMIGLVQLVESHFLGGGKRMFFLGGDMPSTADMHLYWGLNWGLRYHLGTRPEISEETYPTIFEWMNAVEEFIKPRREETKIEMEEAYKVLRVPPTHEHAKFVPHVEGNPEGLSPGQKISVTPVDTGKSGPQFGELISLNFEQVCLRNEKGLVMHFPRLGYEVVAA